MGTDIHFMRTAISLAESNLKSLDGGPFGCVVVKDGKVLSAESNTVIRDCDPTAHAEMNAIRRAAKRIKSRDLSGCVLYTSSEPCPMCLSAIYWSNIRKVYYGSTKRDAEWAGFADQFILRELKKDLDEQEVTFVQIGAADAMEVFNKWVNSESAFKNESHPAGESRVCSEHNIGKSS